MLWCHNCKKEYDQVEENQCPICGEPLEQLAPEAMEAACASWSIHPGDEDPQWPVDANGTPEQAVFLTSGADLGSSGDITASMLKAFGVPVLQRYPGDGQLGKVVLGFSGYGSDLYVPRSKLELAQELLKPVDEEDM